MFLFNVAWFVFSPTVLNAAVVLDETQAAHLQISDSNLVSDWRLLNWRRIGVKVSPMCTVVRVAIYNSAAPVWQTETAGVRQRGGTWQKIPVMMKKKKTQNDEVTRRACIHLHNYVRAVRWHLEDLQMFQQVIREQLEGMKLK